MPRAATKVKMVKAKTFVLSPGKQYIIAFKQGDITLAQAQHLLEELYAKDIKAVGVALYEGADIKIIELPKENESV